MTAEVSKQRVFVPTVSTGAVVTKQRVFVPIIDTAVNPGLGASRRRQAMTGTF